MINVEFQLQNIKIVQKVIVETDLLYVEEIKREDVKTKIIYDFKSSDEIVQVLVRIIYEIEQQDNTQILIANFVILYTFHVKNYDSILANEDSKKFLFLQLINITYSSSRGIIFSESQGFSLNKYYLSPANPIEIYNLFINTLNTT